MLTYLKMVKDRVFFFFFFFLSLEMFGKNSAYYYRHVPKLSECRHEQTM